MSYLPWWLIGGGAVLLAAATQRGGGSRRRRPEKRRPAAAATGKLLPGALREAAKRGGLVLAHTPGPAAVAELVAAVSAGERGGAARAGAARAIAGSGQPDATARAFDVLWDAIAHGVDGANPATKAAVTAALAWELYGRTKRPRDVVLNLLARQTQVLWTTYSDVYQTAWAAANDIAPDAELAAARTAIRHKYVVGYMQALSGAGCGGWAEGQLRLCGIKYVGLGVTTPCTPGLGGAVRRSIATEASSPTLAHWELGCSEPQAIAAAGAMAATTAYMVGRLVVRNVTFVPYTWEWLAAEAFGVAEAVYNVFV